MAVEHNSELMAREASGGSALSRSSSDQTLPDNPYPSLSSYDSRYRALFAGRDADVQRFAELINRSGTRVLVLHGESGVGKSSFLLAGIIPTLELDSIGFRVLRPAQSSSGPEPVDESRVFFLRATNDLSGQLALWLASYTKNPIRYRSPEGKVITFCLWDHLGDAFEDKAVTAEMVQNAFLNDPSLLGKALATMGRYLPYGPVLIIDQGEEVFTSPYTLSDDASRQRARKSSLLALEMLRLAGNTFGDFRIIVSLRTEYYGRLISRLSPEPGKKGRVRAYLLRDLSQDQIVEAIERPTSTAPLPGAKLSPRAKYQFSYAPGVAERIAREALEYCSSRQDSVLPLVQVICSQLYGLTQQRSNKEIQQEDLNTVGGIQGGMQSHVETRLNSLFPDVREQQAFKNLFRHLYILQPDGTLTTKYMVKEELRKDCGQPPSFEKLLEQATQGDLPLLRVNRFSIVGQAEKPYVSLGHDALAPVAARWDEESRLDEKVRLQRNRFLKRYVIPGLFLAVLVMLGLVFYFMWVRFDEARHTIEEDRQAWSEFLKLSDGLAKLPGSDPLRKEMLQTIRQHIKRLRERWADRPELKADEFLVEAIVSTQLNDCDQALEQYKHALDLYARLAATDPNQTDYQRKQAKCYEGLGACFFQSRKTAPSDEAYAYALQLRQKLAENNPNNLDDQSQLAVDLNRIGAIYYNTERIMAAAQPFQKALALNQTLTLKDPENVEYQFNLAVTMDHLGLIHDAKGEGRDAAERYEEAGEIFERLLKAAPEDPRFRKAVTINRNNLGAVYHDLGELQKAREAYDRVLLFRRQLHQEHPNDPDYRSDLASVLINLGNVARDGNLGSTGFAEARSAYEEALKLYKDLVMGFPGRPGYQNERARCQDAEGEMYRLRGDLGLAESNCKEGLLGREKLVDQDGKKKYPSDYAGSCASMGTIEQAKGDFKKALEWYNKAIPILMDAQRSNPLLQKRLSSTYVARAVTLERLDRRDEAAKDWTQVRDICKEQTYLIFRLNRAVALAHLGEHEQATKAVESLETEKLLRWQALYQAAAVWALAATPSSEDKRLPAPTRTLRKPEDLVNRALALLEQARSQGYFRPDLHRDELRTDPDFAALRSRAEFTRLIAAPTD